MPAGPYCARCQTHVLLEQDGVSCSNCGTQLTTLIPAGRQRPATPPATAAQPAPDSSPARAPAAPAPNNPLSTGRPRPARRTK